MIAVILGGSRSVWDEARAALALIGDRPHMIVATNVAGTRYPGELDAWASLHPDFFANTLPRRIGAGFNRPLLYAPAKHSDTPGIKPVAPRWDGSSSLYAAQIAMKQLKAGKVILCGAPLDAEAGHIAVPGAWNDPERYRAGFEAARPDIEGRVKSMGGWTANLLGAPDAAWIAAKA